MPLPSPKTPSIGGFPFADCIRNRTRPCYQLSGDTALAFGPRVSEKRHTGKIARIPAVAVPVSFSGPTHSRAVSPSDRATFAKRYEGCVPKPLPWGTTSLGTQHLPLFRVFQKSDILEKSRGSLQSLFPLVSPVQPIRGLCPQATFVSFHYRFFFLPLPLLLLRC